MTAPGSALPGRTHVRRLRRTNVQPCIPSYDETDDFAEPVGYDDQQHARAGASRAQSPPPPLADSFDYPKLAQACLLGTAIMIIRTLAIVYPCHDYLCPYRDNSYPHHDYSHPAPPASCPPDLFEYRSLRPRAPSARPAHARPVLHVGRYASVAAHSRGGLPPAYAVVCSQDLCVVRNNMDLLFEVASNSSADEVAPHPADGM